MSAIERIQGFACKVTQEQWEELVRVSDSVGCPIGTASRTVKQPTENYASWNSLVECLGVYCEKFSDCTLIPYPDFLSKLKGEEKWEPKNGEEVEIDYQGSIRVGTFIGMDGELMVCKLPDVIVMQGYNPKIVKPSRQTITRQEAEAILNKRIID
jgi:hypothetical protein